MSLRFRQSLRSPDLGPSGPEREAAHERLRERTPFQGLRRKKPFAEGGGIAMIGPGVPAWPEALRAEEEPSRKVREARAPEWLGGKFRPRNLTLDGQRFLERMSPEIVHRQGPADILIPEPWGSLEDRMAYLQRKYLALDMVRKGFAVEEDGRFWPWDYRFDAQKAAEHALVRRRTSQAEPPMEFKNMLTWLGAYREASWDQLRALHPENQDGVDRIVEWMVRHGSAERRRVEFGLGSLSTIRLSKLGMECLKGLPDGKDLLRRGFGNRGTGPGYGEYHEQAVGDAIGYFTHELQVNGHDVTGISLDAALRREYLGSPHIPDLRVEFRNEFGESHWDIEVVGVGQRYDSRGKQASKLSSVTVRGFDPKGRSSSKRSLDVGVKR